MRQPADLASHDWMPFPYDHVITAGDLRRVLNEFLRPILLSVSAQRATVTGTKPLTVNLGSDGNVTPVALAGLSAPVGAHLLVFYVPAVDTYYAVAAVT